jgi:hypothetical protein
MIQGLDTIASQYHDRNALNSRTKAGRRDARVFLAFLLPPLFLSVVSPLFPMMKGLSTTAEIIS